MHQRFLMACFFVLLCVGFDCRRTFAGDPSGENIGGRSKQSDDKRELESALQERSTTITNTAIDHQARRYFDLAQSVLEKEYERCRSTLGDTHPLCAYYRGTLAHNDWLRSLNAADFQAYENARSRWGTAIAKRLERGLSDNADLFGSISEEYRKLNPPPFAIYAQCRSMEAAFLLNCGKFEKARGASVAAIALFEKCGNCSDEVLSQLRMSQGFIEGALGDKHQEWRRHVELFRESENNDGLIKSCLRSDLAINLVRTLVDVEASEQADKGVAFVKRILDGQPSIDIEWRLDQERIRID